jgi:hypothetical protein
MVRCWISKYREIEPARAACFDAYIDDFELMMLIALASIPLLLLLREARHRPSPR